MCGHCLIGRVSDRSFLDTKISTNLKCIILVLVLQFFRNPKRVTSLNEKHIISPVDGKVVIVEEVHEKEYFKDNVCRYLFLCLPSMCMLPAMPSVDRLCLANTIRENTWWPGIPKSSELNERTTVVVENKSVGQILYRQIAGAVARRIVNYAKVGDQAVQGADAGFIKFGSRVDLFLPLDTKINVQKDQIVKGGVDCIAEV